MHPQPIAVAAALFAVCTFAVAAGTVGTTGPMPERIDTRAPAGNLPASSPPDMYAAAPTVSTQSDPDFVSPDDPEVIAAWRAGDASSLALDPRFYDKRWTIESINGSALGIEGLEMTFKPRAFAGFDGCNRNSGVYYPDGTGLRFEPRFKQERGCPGAIRVERMKNFEYALSILARATEFRFELPRLTVKSGTATLVLSTR